MKGGKHQIQREVNICLHDAAALYDGDKAAGERVAEIARRIVRSYPDKRWRRRVLLGIRRFMQKVRG